MLIHESVKGRTWLTRIKKRFPDAGEEILNSVISIPPKAEEKSFHLQSLKISQSRPLLRNDVVYVCHALPMKSGGIQRGGEVEGGMYTPAPLDSRLKHAGMTSPRND